jgi:hypothetical protein
MGRLIPAGTGLSYHKAKYQAQQYAKDIEVVS